MLSGPDGGPGRVSRISCPQSGDRGPSWDTGRSLLMGSVGFWGHKGHCNFTLNRAILVTLLQMPAMDIKGKGPCDLSL
jgi:hypothetical protein